MKVWRILNVFLIFFIGCWLWIPTTLFAQSSVEDEVYLDRTQLVSQQLNLLKNRLTQTQNELMKLQYQQESDFAALTTDKVNKSLLSQARLDIAGANSNLDSISIEFNESIQAINRLEKLTQEIDNQLNVVSIFGFKVIHMGKLDVNHLKHQLSYQDNLLELEKQRADNLKILKELAGKTLQLYQKKYAHIEALLKSQTIMQLQEQQAKAELAFQQEQGKWLNQLNELNAQLTHLELTKHSDTLLHGKLVADIFYVNENINFSYLQMLIARYQDQIQQLRVSIARGSSITWLNKINAQVQVLSKQLVRVTDLLKTRIAILEKRKQLRLLSKQETVSYPQQIQKLNEQYQSALKTVNLLNQQLAVFRITLDKTLQQELSSRQALPGWNGEAWLSLGAEILLLPTLAFHVMKSLASSFIESFGLFDYQGWIMLLTLELLWWLTFYFIRRFLIRAISKSDDHEFGHVNLKWLGLKWMHRNLIDIAIIGNAIGLFYFCDIPEQSVIFAVNFAWIWLLFKAIITLGRLYLVESVHDRTGADVRLYSRLKWIFLVGGITTALAIFVFGLPVSYELKDLFARLFLLFLLCVAIIFLKNWSVLSGLVIHHIDDRRTYLRRLVRLLSILVPLTLIVNSAVGLFGYVNLVYTISWYEGVFLFVLAGYLILRGVLIEIMEFFSRILISYVSNGWLWTEAFLKPFDRVLRIALFLMSWALLFIFYGWDRQSPVVERLGKLIHYRVGEILNTVITPLSVIELLVIVSLLYWAAKWTREFVYRLLLSRTQDLGIRNSIAILSQYMMIVIGILIGLRVLGIDLGALTVVAGAFAVTAGLGLRDLVNNLASGFLLLIERPLRVGDTVTIDTHEGEVINLGSRAVTVRTWDHVDIFVPNAEICSKIFVNWTSKDNIVRTVDMIDVDQTESALQVQQLIYHVLAQIKDVLKDPVPEVFIKELKEGAIRFEVRYFVNLRLIKSRPGLRSEVLMSIWQAFESQGIKTSYPVRELRQGFDHK